MTRGHATSTSCARKGRGRIDVLADNSVVEVHGWDVMFGHDRCRLYVHMVDGMRSVSMQVAGCRDPQFSASHVVAYSHYHVMKNLLA